MSDLVREQRRLALEELDVLRVLDERGQIDPTVGRDGESARMVREKLETARALESLPAVAAAAHAGDLSAEQLGSVVKLADEDVRCGVGAAGTARGAGGSGASGAGAVEADGGGMAGTRRRRGVCGCGGHRRRGCCICTGELPDVMGAKFEAMIQRLTERTRPPKGQPWAAVRAARRGCVRWGCVTLCETAERATPTLAAKPLLVVQVPTDGPAEIAGIPLADAVVEQLARQRADRTGPGRRRRVPVAVGKRTTALVTQDRPGGAAYATGIAGCRAVRSATDCRSTTSGPGPGVAATTSPNLAAVCTAAGHHQMLIPHGPWALVGNPNQPDGLRLVHLDDLTEADAAQLGLPRSRARPGAA